MSDESDEVRMESINGLRWLKDRRAIPHISALLQKETDPQVVDMARRTLREFEARSDPPLLR
jgi:hypothetical protein